MLYTFNLETVNIWETFDNLTVIVFSPVILPVAAAVKQPVVQAAIKVAIALSELFMAAIAEIVDFLAKITADFQANYLGDKQERRKSTMSQISFIDGRSQVANDVINVISDFNADVERMSEGIVDLRLLLPVGLGTLAIYQLIAQGLDLTEIPWHTLAWYAFDTFVKLNHVGEL